MSNTSALALATTGSTLAGTPGLIANGAIPQETPAPDAAPKDLESTRFSHLAKKESALVKEREALRNEKKEFEAQREKLVAAEKRLQEFDQLKEKDAIAAMKFAGFSDTDIMNYFASMEDKSTPEEKAAKAAQSEIQKFKDEQAKIQQEAQDKKNSEVITKFKSDISKHLASDKDKYEYCNFNGVIAEELILETVYQVLEDTQEVISIDEAAQMVEEYYEGLDKQMSTLKKRQPKEAVEHAKQQVEMLKAEVSPGMPNKSSKTLSNKATVTVANTIPKVETRQQKRDRLIQKLANGG